MEKRLVMAEEKAVHYRLGQSLRARHHGNASGSSSMDAAPSVHHIAEPLDHRRLLVREQDSEYSTSLERDRTREV